MYYRRENLDPMRMDLSIYNNTTTIVILVRGNCSIRRIKFFVERYGYYYSLEEIEEHLSTPFFKERLDEYLASVDDDEDYLAKLNLKNRK